MRREKLQPVRSLKIISSKDCKETERDKGWLIKVKQFVSKTACLAWLRTYELRSAAW